MGSFAPVFLAFLLNCFGVNIFREPKNPGCEPLVSCLIFLFAVFILLWDLRLYPTSLRRVWSCGAKFLDFLLAMFLMEAIMSDFWFPLDTFTCALLPKIADAEKELLVQGGWEGDGILQFLRWEITCVVCSYMLSIFFFLAVLHATRAVDFRLLKFGVGVFSADVASKLKRLRQKVFRSFKKKRECGAEVDFLLCDSGISDECPMSIKNDGSIDTDYLNQYEDYRDCQCDSFEDYERPTRRRKKTRR